ncbi:MAG: ABC transporter ATP-binding protein [Thermodesulfobacteriota bacterium]
MLTIRNLSVYYSNIQALQDVSLSVEEGEIATLIGANGAGKSTLLKTISRIHPLTRGDINFLGHDLTKLSAAQVVKAGISHAPEGRRIFPEMTVLENLEMGAYTKGSSFRNNLDRVYRIFPVLKERREQLGETLSGGEQQMLTIGRALMATPKLLLLDEPSMGLAPTLVRTIFDIIQQINREGTTVLLVEQNASMALSIAKTGYVIETGRVILKDTARNLILNPQVREAYLGKRATSLKQSKGARL